MLHILFTLLKIIGILLLAILCILLFLLLVVLFVPIKYHVSAEKSEGLKAQGKITWLLRIISVFVLFENGNLSFSVSIFGKSLLNNKEQKKGKQTTSGQEKTELPPIVFEEEDEDIPVADAPEFMNTEIMQDTISEEYSVPEPEPAAEEVIQIETEEEKQEPKRKHFSLKETISSIKTIFSKISSAFSNLSETIRHFRELFSTYTEFWHRNTTQNAFHHVLREIRYLLKHILPRKGDGQFCFGFEDPAATGQLLGVLSVITGMCSLPVQLEASFEEPVLEGNFCLKGHIRICHFVKSLISIVLDKNARKTFSDFRKLRASS